MSDIDRPIPFDGVWISAALEDLYPCDPAGFEGFVNGAAVAFGLMKMADAIRSADERRAWERYCRKHGHNFCPFGECHRCGALRASASSRR